MKWMETARGLLTENKPVEALNLIKDEVAGDNEVIIMLLAQYDRRLSSSEINLQKGSKLMAEALTEKTKVRFELERLLKSVQAATSILEKPSILFIGAKPNGLPISKIDAEYIAIKETLQEAEFDFTLPINSSIRPNKFGALLKKHTPTYLHFAGHGVEAVPGFNGQGVVFEAPNKDPIVPPNTAVVKTLSTTLNTIKIKGVILNACHSFQLAKEISELGIYAIGMMDEISDDSAIAFSEGFYSNFGTLEQNFEEAFEFGVNNIGMYGEDYLPFVSIPAIFHAGKKLN
ncbi:MAG: CHAT domain-containing protein [Lewinella sp.]